MKTEWEYEKLGNVCVSFSGYTPSADLLKDKGIYPYFKVAEMNRPQNKRTLISTNAYIDNPSRIYKKGAIVFPKNGAAISTNKKRMLAQDCVVDLNTGGFLVDDIKLNNWYFFYYMQHLDFQMFVRRGAVPTLDIAELKKLDVPIPSLSEQQHIVEELDLLSSIIEKKKVQLKELDNLAQSLFYEMFGDPITNDKGWEVKKIGDCFSYIKNGANIKQTKGASGYPITRIETLSNSVFNRDRFGYANIYDLTKYTNYVLNDGDLLMSHINSKAYIGRTVMYKKEDEEKIIHGMNLLRLVVIYDLLIPTFADYYFKTEFFKDEVAKIRKDAVNQSSMAIGDLKMIRIFLPPLALQQIFASKIEAIEHQKELIKHSVKEVETLFNSRMDYYFN